MCVLLSLGILTSSQQLILDLIGYTVIFVHVSPLDALFLAIMLLFTMLHLKTFLTFMILLTMLHQKTLQMEICSLFWGKIVNKSMKVCSVRVRVYVCGAHNRSKKQQHYNLPCLVAVAKGQ